MRPGWCFYKIYDPGLTGTTVFILGLYTIVKSLYLLAGTHPGSDQMINISHRWFQWSRLKKIVLTSSLHVVVASFFQEVAMTLQIRSQFLLAKPEEFIERTLGSLATWS